MSRRKHQGLTIDDLKDLKYVPKGRQEWDCTLAALAYEARRDIERRPPDLNAWAARHGVPLSARYAALGEAAWVLWHGTTRQRAEKIAEHGLFSFKGLWTTFRPHIAHGFCRGRADRFGTPGAMVCLVLDSRELIEGQHYQIQGAADVVRFHRGIGPAVIEYVLFEEEVRFAGGERLRGGEPWVSARFKRQSGVWVPVQQAPVRYSEAAAYSSVEEFAELTAARLFAELGAVAAIELFSTLYAVTRPWDALSHDVALGILEQSAPRRRAHVVFRKRAESRGLAEAGLRQ